MGNAAGIAGNAAGVVDGVRAGIPVVANAASDAAVEAETISEERTMPAMRGEEESEAEAGEAGDMGMPSGSTASLARGIHTSSDGGTGGTLKDSIGSGIVKYFGFILLLPPQARPS